MVGAVNLTNGKIIGCKEGSLAWHHEVGHIKYNQSVKGIRLSNLQNWSIKFFFVLIWALYKYRSYYLWFSSAFLLLFYFGVDIYEEIWCWIYAYKNVGNKRKNKNN